MTNPIYPKYYQVKQTIKRWIISNKLGPGDKIPTEMNLAENFQVNRLTVRQAIAQLSQEGFLKSKRGVGTFVTESEEVKRSTNLEFSGFLDDLFYQVTKVKSIWVEIREIAVPSWVKNRLAIEDDTVIRIRRIRHKDDRPFAYTINYIPIKIGTKINERELYRKPLLQIMEEDLKVKFVEAVQTIEASFADQETAEKLDLESGSPILFVERIMYTAKGKPIELVQSSHRGDEYKYLIRLKSIGGKRGNWRISQK